MGYGSSRSSSRTKFLVKSPEILIVCVVYNVLYAIMRQNKRDNCVIKSPSLSFIYGETKQAG